MQFIIKYILFIRSWKVSKEAIQVNGKLLYID